MNLEVEKSTKKRRSSGETLALFTQNAGLLLKHAKRMNLL